MNEMETKKARLSQLLPIISSGDINTPGYQAAVQEYSALKAEIAKLEQEAAAKREEEARKPREQQADIIHSLNVIANGGGQAYGKTMSQVNQGNARIQALAQSGRGGLNAGLNAQNARASNTVRGTQQANLNRASEVSQAQSALGNAIAQGQDMNVQQGRDTLNALAQAPAPGPNQTQQLISGAGQLGQAVWTANQKGGQTDAQKSQSNYKKW